MAMRWLAYQSSKVRRLATSASRERKTKASQCARSDRSQRNWSTVLSGQRPCSMEFTDPERPMLRTLSKTLLKNLIKRWNPDKTRKKWRFCSWTKFLEKSLLIWSPPYSKNARLVRIPTRRQALLNSCRRFSLSILMTLVSCRQSQNSTRWRGVHCFRKWQGSLTA